LTDGEAPLGGGASLPTEIEVNMTLTAAVSALALVALSAPASAQHQHMPGTTMPAPAKPAKKKPPPKTVKKPAKKAAAKKKIPATPKSSATHADQAAEPASGPPGKAGMTMPMDHPQHGTMAIPAQPESRAAAPMPAMDHAQLGQMPMEHGGHTAMKGALGPYPMEREASGTAWQPDASEHAGLMSTGGEWTLMAHGVLNLVYDHQSGRRGDDKAFLSGMAMGMARRPLGKGTLQFRAALSPDPIMGKSGYPLLLASGETADGVDRLIDRQHPHDLFMELSASVSQNLGPKSSVFLYAGLPGEPAFGPPAFMHREAIMDSPEAPISHHWLDSTHISFGVVTAGIGLDRVKLEVSRFNAREPDQHRWNIETGPLDSTAIRLSWNASAQLALQGSWGHFEDPEQLEPGIDQKRWSASLLYAREIAPGWKFAGTLAWGRKSVEHHHDDAFVAEASLKHAGWTMFGRGEMTENRELLDINEHGPAYRVGKVSLGAVRDFSIGGSWSIGVGGLFAVNFVPKSLAPLYSGRRPTGAMGFVRLKLD
jgi:hypothetical protein